MSNMNTDLAKEIYGVFEKFDIKTSAFELNRDIKIQLVTEVVEDRHDFKVIVPFAFKDAVFENNILLTAKEIDISVNGMASIALLHKLDVSEVIETSMKQLNSILETRIIVPTLAVFTE